MWRKSFVSLLFLCGSMLSASGSASGQTAGGSAPEQGNALLEEIRSLMSDAGLRASASEAAQPPQVSVASCLNQVVQTLGQYESSGSAALNSLTAAVSGGDAGTAQAQLSLLLLANKNAKTAAAAASACEAGGVASGGVDANGDGVPDGVPDGESSSGGLSGLDDLQGDEESEDGFAPDEFVPSGDSVDDPATSDVVTSPAVTP